MPSRARYDTDLTDAQFALIEPLLPQRKAGGAKGGRPPLAWREILNAILYIVRTGAAWRHMPHDLVNWHSAYHYFRLWSRDGRWQTIHEALRARVRESEEARNESPSAAIVDSQSSKTTLKGGIHAATTRERRSKAPSATCSSTPSDSCLP